MEITSYNTQARHDQTCVSSMLPIQKKQSPDLLFFLSSSDSTCNILSREIGGKRKVWFQDCIVSTSYKIKQSNLMPLGLGTKS
jgi:hypothetical protein